MRCFGCDHGVDRRLQGAVGGVFEAHRHRQAAGHLAVSWALGRAGTDRPEHDRVGDVLRRDRLQKLRRGRQAHAGDFDEQGSRQPQPCCHVERVVEMRVVDQTLPTHRRSRLLEIDPHDYEQTIGHPPGERVKPGGVLAGRVGVVDRAGTNHYQQPRIGSGEHPLGGAATLDDRAECRVIQRQEGAEPSRRHERFETPDPEVRSRGSGGVRRGHPITIHDDSRRGLTALGTAGSIRFRNGRREVHPGGRRPQDGSAPADGKELAP